MKTLEIQPVNSKKLQAYALFISISILLPVLVNAQTNWHVPKEAIDLKNPVANTAASLKEAKVLYTTNCVPCHGTKGKGDGVAAAALNPKPADHSSEKVQKETDGQLFWEIGEGHNPMPPYKNALTETQRWELVNYIRTLAKTSKKQ